MASPLLREPEIDDGPVVEDLGETVRPDASASVGALPPASDRGPGVFGRVVGFLAPVLILAGGVVGFLVLLSLKEPPAAKEITVPVARVRTVPVGTAKSSFDIVTTGSVVPFREVDIAAEVDGRIVERGENLRAGRFVRAGETLAVIDPTDYRLSVRQWEQEKAQAERRVAENDVEVENAERSLDVARETLALRDRDVERIRGLRGRGAGTVADYEDALISRAAAKTTAVELENRIRQLQAGRARLEQAAELAEARLEQARTDLRRTKIVAPIDGVIVETGIEEDNFVRRGDPIAVLDDTAAVEVRCPLEASELAWIRAHPPRGWTADGGADDAYELPPVPATITFDVLGNTYAWEAELCRVEGLGADQATRTVPVRLLVSQPRQASLRSGSAALPISPPGALARGMFVTIRLHATAEREMIAIPERAVRPGGTVWVDRDGTLEIVALPAAKTVDGEVLVPRAVSPLQPDDALIVSPLPFAVDGMALESVGEAEEA